MKRPNTYSEVIITTDPDSGLQVRSWKKKCICCGKEYVTTSRSQKFCSDVCLKKATSKKRKQKKEYNETIAMQRLYARAHSIGVEVIKQLVALNVIEYKCECCGATESLEVHHRSFRYFDNSPENLQLVCNKCHNKIHSEFDTKMKEEGMDKQSLFTSVEWNLYKQVLK